MQNQRVEDSNSEFDHTAQCGPGALRRVFRWLFNRYTVGAFCLSCVCFVCALFEHVPYVKMLDHQYSKIRYLDSIDVVIETMGDPYEIYYYQERGRTESGIKLVAYRAYAAPHLLDESVIAAQWKFEIDSQGRVVWMQRTDNGC